jgi:hypothetical protein
MATVNALKCKHLENEAKMNFTYLQQSSAHSNSISNDLVKLFSWAGHQNWQYLIVFKLLVCRLIVSDIYSFILLCTTTKITTKEQKTKPVAMGQWVAPCLGPPWWLLLLCHA